MDIDKAEKMNLPEISDIVTIKEALELCRYFGLDYLIDRIESDPGIVILAADLRRPACHASSMRILKFENVNKKYSASKRRLEISHKRADKRR